MTLFVVSKAARTRVRTGVRIQQIRVPPFNPRVRFRPGDGRRPSLMGSIPLGVICTRGRNPLCAHSRLRTYTFITAEPAAAARALHRELLVVGRVDARAGRRGALGFAVQGAWGA